MKKIFFIAFMLLTSAFIVFTGCKPEEETPTGPSLSLMAGTGYITANATVEPGDTVKFKWTATKGTTGEDAKLASFTIKIEGQPATDVNNKSWNAAAVSNDETYVDEAAFWVGSNEGTKLFSLTITDKDGLYKELTVTITIEQQVVNTPIDSYLNKTLVSAYNASTTNTQYIDALTGTLYNHTASGAASNATFGFVSGGSGNGACIFTSDNDLTLSQQPTGWA
ncbi:MAG: hypothetical protein HY738_08915, partial [Bacteroidia bacterium]|nr:hypothetical protein [Bacteroidia bacterium]